MDRMDQEMNTFADGVESATTRNLLTTFEHKTPEIVFEWSDAETGARGWTVTIPYVAMPPAAEHGCVPVLIVGRSSPWLKPWK